ncbi:MAG: tripartite tricarboxylate transporter substrate binding protein [Pelistega sp.]|nr:tripartite tricarboxylate transporter substrate binding protein [Pelistega sp.]
MRKTSFFQRAALSAVLGFGLVAGSVAQAQAETKWPEQQVRILVGFSPGGTTDVLARIVAKELSDSLGQTVMVENKPGAGSNIATEQTARAKPDGYTLMMMAITTTINQTLYKNVKFDVEKDFVPVALVAKVPNILVANKNQPYNSVKELVEYAKANPEGVVYSSSGSGTSMHLSGELFKQQADVQMLHIPYKGSGPAMTGLLGGEVHVMFDNMPSSAPHVKSGNLKPLAVTTAERSPTFPDVPTLKESGYPDYSVTSWFGIVAPTGTPPEVVAKLHDEIEKILEKPAVVEQLDGLGAVSEKMTSEQFGDFIKAETASWGAVINKGGISVD